MLKIFRKFVFIRSKRLKCNKSVNYENARCYHRYQVQPQLQQQQQQRGEMQRCHVPDFGRGLLSPSNGKVTRSTLPTAFPSFSFLKGYERK
jgi:hypothetical protein